MQAVSIGEAARATGVKVPTIRYYESIGLLRSVARSLKNRRTYSTECLRQLRFIKRARLMGFDLTEVRSLLRLQEDPSQPCGDADRIARHRLCQLDEMLRELRQLRGELVSMIGECSKRRVSTCRVLGELNRGAVSV